ncbi:MAG: hypothetical protein QW757_05880 [Candidatus Woesearchaeota archaeon]
MDNLESLVKIFIQTLSDFLRSYDSNSSIDYKIDKNKISFSVKLSLSIYNIYQNKGYNLFEMIAKYIPSLVVPKWRYRMKLTNNPIVFDSDYYSVDYVMELNSFNGSYLDNQTKF